MSRRFVIRIPMAVLLAALSAGVASAQLDPEKIEITTTSVGPQIHMLKGAGGAIGVFSGPDGVLVIDDQFAPLSEKLLAAIRKISDRPLRFVLNTHWHGDHTGGNENFSRAGAEIIAHDHVIDRMTRSYENPVFGWKAEPSPAAALPAVTVNDSVTFHMNGERVVCFHLPAAHTDGDLVVWFPDENVIHAGDVVFNGLYPIIDVGSGGTIAGMLAAQERVYSMANDSTRIINGHGPLATRADVRAGHDMLVRVRDRVKNLLAQNMTLEEIIAAKPLADLDATWGKGFVKSEHIIKTAVLDLQRK